MLWDLVQHYQIGQLEDRLDLLQDAASRETVARDANKQLAEKVERLALITRALFELLQESTGISEERLRAKISEIGQVRAGFIGRSESYNLSFFSAPRAVTVTRDPNVNARSLAVEIITTPHFERHFVQLYRSAWRDPFWATPGQQTW